MSQRHRLGSGIVFEARATALRSGDILLTRNTEGNSLKGLATSAVITGASKGRFDHAAICLAPPTFAEAIGTGVTNLTLLRCFVHHIENVRVLRYPDLGVATRAAKLAARQTGRGYSKRKAVASVFPQALMDEIGHRGIFCSALVAQVFSEAGAPEFRRTPIQKTTPATLDALEGLRDVTHEVFHPRSAPSNIDQMSALDGERIPSPSAAMTEILIRYGDAIFAEADALVSDYPEAGLKAPDSFFETFDLIMAALDAPPRIAEPRRGAFLAALEALDRRAAALLASGEIHAVQKAVIDMDNTELMTCLRQSFEARPAVDPNSIRGLLALAPEQLQARTRDVLSLRPWATRSDTIGRWVEISEAALELMRCRAVLLKEVLDRLGTSY